MFRAGNIAMAGLTLMVALSGCGVGVEGVDEGLVPETETSSAELMNNGGGAGTGPSCSGKGNPGCSITCNNNEIAVCSDGLCIQTFLGVCIRYDGAASCSCKARSIYKYSTGVTFSGGATQTAP
ncbi:MAG: hypothetical protein JNK82_31790 [Myxococcaceae bacterium]|nr:hypothetical protein [Myxococcaceae bacterium]